jgi:hypothetical protein
MSEGIDTEIFLGMKNPLIIAATYAGNLDFAGQAVEIVRTAAAELPM